MEPLALRTDVELDFVVGVCLMSRDQLPSSGKTGVQVVDGGSRVDGHHSLSVKVKLN